MPNEGESPTAAGLQPAWGGGVVRGGLLLGHHADERPGRGRHPRDWRDLYVGGQPPDCHSSGVHAGDAPEPGQGSGRWASPQRRRPAGGGRQGPGLPLPGPLPGGRNGGAPVWRRLSSHGRGFLSAVGGGRRAAHRRGHGPGRQRPGAAGRASFPARRGPGGLHLRGLCPGRLAV